MNPLITKRCSPIEEAIYQDGFQAGAASRDAEVAMWIERVNSWTRDCERLADERDQLRARATIAKVMKPT